MITEKNNELLIFYCQALLFQRYVMSLENFERGKNTGKMKTTQGATFRSAGSEGLTQGSHAHINTALLTFAQLCKSPP